MELNNRLKGVDVSQKLEKSIRAHQLLSYPSEDQSFNRAYEGALQSLNSSALVRELYIVQYKAGDGELGFGYISGASISANGPYYLTDICAVVENRPRHGLSFRQIAQLVAPCVRWNATLAWFHNPRWIMWNGPGTSWC
jgi:hypothetical protein